MTIKQLREYLDTMEESWNDLDREYLGEFEEQALFTFNERNELGKMKIDYLVTGLGFVVFSDSAIKKGDKL